MKVNETYNFGRIQVQETNLHKERLVSKRKTTRRKENLKIKSNSPFQTKPSPGGESTKRKRKLVKKK